MILKKSIVLLAIFIFQSCIHAQVKPSESFIRKLSQGETRGGSTTGVKVDYALNARDSWKYLQKEGLGQKEKDRRAILALAGQYDVDFQFLETYTFDTSTGVDTPYFSSATEFVKVIKSSEDFISLQHIIVMFIVKKGEVHGPIVVKHWRQDWQWQADKRFVYEGDKSWRVETLNEEQMRGKWLWSVYQVDDSPRYSGFGKWQHLESASFFETNTLSRPLPRREFSVRNDYKILMGSETLVVTAQGWFHEQRAFKHKQALVDGQFSGAFLAREFGINSYRSIKNFNWQAGLNYWEKTKKYWADVRYCWRRIIDEGDFTFKQGKKPKLFMVHFSQAENPEILKMNKHERRELIYQTLKEYLL